MNMKELNKEELEKINGGKLLIPEKPRRRKTTEEETPETQDVRNGGGASGTW